MNGRLRMLVTGFGPFPGAPYNPTMPLVERLMQLRRPAFDDVEFSSHVFPVLALKVTQHDHCPVLLRQTAQLQVQHCLEITPGIFLYPGWFSHVRHLRFPQLALRPGRPGLEGGLVSDAVEPVTDLRSGVDRRRLADEDEKRRLERILSVVVVAQDTTADTPNHRAMAAHERFQGRRLSAAHEALQQLGIG